MFYGLALHTSFKPTGFTFRGIFNFDLSLEHSVVEEDVHKLNPVFKWWTSCSPGENCNSLLITVPYPRVTSFFSIFFQYSGGHFSTGAL